MNDRYLVLSSCLSACGDGGEPAGQELRKAPTSAVPDAGGVSQEPEQSGEATHYDAEGVGACGNETPPEEAKVPNCPEIAMRTAHHSERSGPGKALEGAGEMLDFEIADHIDPACR